MITKGAQDLLERGRHRVRRRDLPTADRASANCRTSATRSSSSCPTCPRRGGSTGTGNGQPIGTSTTSRSASRRTEGSSRTWSTRIRRSFATSSGTRCGSRTSGSAPRYDGSRRGSARRDRAAHLQLAWHVIGGMASAHGARHAWQRRPFRAQLPSARQPLVRDPERARHRARRAGRLDLDHGPEADFVPAARARGPRRIGIRDRPARSAAIRRARSRRRERRVGLLSVRHRDAVAVHDRSARGGREGSRLISRACRRPRTARSRSGWPTTRDARAPAPGSSWRARRPSALRPRRRGSGSGPAPFCRLARVERLTREGCPGCAPCR